MRTRRDAALQGRDLPIVIEGDPARTTHYPPRRNQIIHETILDLYGRGEPRGRPITVAQRAHPPGARDQTGSAGAPYLHTLIAYRFRPPRTPGTTPGSSGRRAISPGAWSRAGNPDRPVRLRRRRGTADDLVDRAQGPRCTRFTDQRAVRGTTHSLADIMPGAMDEIEAIGKPAAGR